MIEIDNYPCRRFTRRPSDATVVAVEVTDYYRDPEFEVSFSTTPLINNKHRNSDERIGGLSLSEAAAVRDILSAAIEFADVDNRHGCDSDEDDEDFDEDDSELEDDDEWDDEEFDDDEEECDEDEFDDELDDDEEWDDEDDDEEWDEDEFDEEFETTRLRLPLGSRVFLPLEPGRSIPTENIRDGDTFQVGIDDDNDGDCFVALGDADEIDGAVVIEATVETLPARIRRQGSILSFDLPLYVECESETKKGFDLVGGDRFKLLLGYRLEWDVVGVPFHDAGDPQLRITVTEAL